MYLERHGRGSWCLTEHRAGKGRVVRPCCCTGSWGMERGGVQGEARGAEEELYKLQWHFGECGASARMKQSSTSALLSLLY